MPALTPEANIIALDVGQRRIGVARAGLVARLPQPQGAIMHSDQVMSDIHKLVTQENVAAVVIGLPRGLEGQETSQTRHVREFAQELKAQLDVPIYFQDEALTSKLAEQELHTRGVEYNKEDIDALAATYILRDFLETHQDMPV